MNGVGTKDGEARLGKWTTATTTAEKRNYNRLRQTDSVSIKTQTEESSFGCGGYEEEVSVSGKPITSSVFCPRWSKTVLHQNQNQGGAGTGEKPMYQIAMPFYTTYMPFGMPGPFLPMPMVHSIISYGTPPATTGNFLYTTPSPSRQSIIVSTVDNDAGSMRLSARAGQTELNDRTESRENTKCTARSKAPQAVPRFRSAYIKSEPDMNTMTMLATAAAKAKGTTTNYDRSSVNEFLHSHTAKYCSDTAIDKLNKNQYMTGTSGDVKTKNKPDKIPVLSDAVDRSSGDKRRSREILNSPVYTYAGMRMHELSSDLKDINDNITKLQNKASELNNPDSSPDSKQWLPKSFYTETKDKDSTLSFRYRKFKACDANNLTACITESNTNNSSENSFNGRSLTAHSSSNMKVARNPKGTRDYHASCRNVETSDLVDRLKMTEVLQNHKKNQHIPVKIKSSVTDIPNYDGCNNSAMEKGLEIVEINTSDDSESKRQHTKKQSANISFSIKYDPNNDKPIIIDCSQGDLKSRMNLTVNNNNGNMECLEQDYTSQLDAYKSRQGMMEIEQWLENNVLETNGRSEDTGGRLQQLSAALNGLDILSKISEEDETSSSVTSGQGTMNVDLLLQTAGLSIGTHDQSTQKIVRAYEGIGQRPVGGSVLLIEHELEDRQQETESYRGMSGLEEGGGEGRRDSSSNYYDNRIYLENDMGNTWINVDL